MELCDLCVVSYVPAVNYLTFNLSLRVPYQIIPMKYDTPTADVVPNAKVIPIASKQIKNPMASIYYCTSQSIYVDYKRTKG